MSADRALILTVAFYLLTAFVWVRSGAKGAWGRQSILGGAALLLATADRYFALSHSVADLMRQLAQEQGWYESRRWLQTLAALLILSGVAAIGLIQWQSIFSKRASVRVSARMVCLLTLLSFCALRALSNHFIDAWLTTTLGGLRVNWIIEWLLLGAIIVCSYRASLPAPDSSVS
jgi:hypothetical protein